MKLDKIDQGANAWEEEDRFTGQMRYWSGLSVPCYGEQRDRFVEAPKRVEATRLLVERNRTPEQRERARRQKLKDKWRCPECGEAGEHECGGAAE